MEITGLKKVIQREMSRRRHYGGAEDVPALLWENSEVASAFQRAEACAQREEFTGDWDEAPTSLEEAMDVLASTLRRLAKQNAPKLTTR